MQQLKGIFYHFNYYILPEDKTIDQLKGQVTLQKLGVGDEDLGSIPPYFIDSLVETVAVDIDNPNHIAPCNVFVLTKDEYDERLRNLVETKCKGCSSFSGDTSDLSGHYIEMDLDDMCCLRRQPGDRVIYYDVLYYIIGAKLEKQYEKIKKCIDKGNDKKLTKIFNKELTHVMFPVELFGRVVDGNYVLYARACAGAPEFALDLQFLAQVFNDMPSIFVKNGWKMVPCLKGGVVKYKGKTKLNENSKVAYFTECGEDGQSELRVFIPERLRSNERKAYRYVQDIENYLTCALGEEMYHAWFTIRYIDSDIALAPLGSVVETISNYYHKLPPIPFPEMFQIDMTDGKNITGTPLAGREKIVQLASMAPNLTTITQEDLKKDGPPALWLTHYTFGYIYIPKVEDISAIQEDLFWHFDYRNNKTVQQDKSNLTLLVGQGLCNDGGVIFDLLLPNKNKALDRFRGILPVLKKYNAQISLLDESCKLDTYTCGDKLEKIN